MEVKKGIIPAYILLLLALTGCDNDTQQQTPPEVKFEHIDTSDCSQIVSMIPRPSGGWIFSQKRDFIVKNDSKPSLNIGVQKDSPDDGDRDNLTMTFLLDSAICVDSHNHIVLNFDDTTKLIFKSYADNNCFGDYQIYFDRHINEISQKENTAQLKKLRDNKIRSIIFETHSGTRNYILSDIEATNLMHLINCIHTAK